MYEKRLLFDNSNHYWEVWKLDTYCTRRNHKYTYYLHAGPTYNFQHFKHIVSVFLVNPSINETESAEYLSSQRELFRGLNGLSDEYDLVIVGAGLSGSVIAQQASARAGLRSLIIDKRDHIGGNCFDYVDEHGIRVTFCIICFLVYKKEHNKFYNLPSAG